LMGSDVPAVEIDALARAVGFKKVDVINPFNFTELLAAIKDHTDSPEPSLLVAKYPCVLQIREKKPAPRVDLETCVECGSCLRIGCVPLSKIDSGVAIDSALCNGCGFCVDVCHVNAIRF
ncbi:MAG: 4Fe-4S binding protein, partial [Peptococcaceae bacterium]|nr:4Fe-4S binding protein [Peptococcaceae bacterium]